MSVDFTDLQISSLKGTDFGFGFTQVVDVLNGCRHFLFPVSLNKVHKCVLRLLQALVYTSQYCYGKLWHFQLAYIYIYIVEHSCLDLLKLLASICIFETDVHIAMYSWICLSVLWYEQALSSSFSCCDIVHGCLWFSCRDLSVFLCYQWCMISPSSDTS